MGFLYVLQFGEELIFKIGFTTRSVELRVRELSTGSAFPLTLVAQFDLPRELIRQCEAFVHASLDHLRYRKGGQEFFRAEPKKTKEDFCLEVSDSVLRFELLTNQAARMSGVPLGDAEEAGEILSMARFPQEARELTQAVLRERSSIVAQTRQLDLRRKALEDALKTRFGAVDCLLDDEGSEVLRWEKTQQRHFDLARFRVEQPDLAQHYTETRSVRTLRFG